MAQVPPFRQLFGVQWWIWAKLKVHNFNTFLNLDLKIDRLVLIECSALYKLNSNENLLKLGYLKTFDWINFTLKNSKIHVLSFIKLLKL